MLKLGVTFLAILVLSEAAIDINGRIQKFFEEVQKNDTLMHYYLEHLKEHKNARERYMQHKARTDRATHQFTCLNDYSILQSFPTNVHSLRPEHISVIAAMGDSLTAGNGILGTNILDCLTEYRGRSWSIGGDLNFDQGVETLPNILKKYNPMLHGYSLGKCDTSNYACSQLNVAVAGAVANDMPSQAVELVRRLNDTNFGVDTNNEWKVITLFIGGNDLCDICNNADLHSPNTYINKIREALDYLHANVPKAFVNLVEIFDITPLAKVSQGFFCNLITQSVCGCARNTGNNAMLQWASGEYQASVRNLVASGRYDTRNDFTVVLQPFFRNTEPVKDYTGSYDLAYFAPDCFHFSDLGANAAGKSLWNNMIEPESMKQIYWHLNDPYHCPHTHTANNGAVFQTRLN
ncbi:Lysophospholipase 1 [Mactra antiquata]